MTGHVRVGGVWKEIAQPYVRVGGAWKEVTEAWTRVGGVWKKWFEPSGAFELISSQTLSSSSSSITFSSIPQTYKHLQVRMSLQKTSNTSVLVQLRGDTGTNYAYSLIRGTSSSVLNQSGDNRDNIFLSTHNAVSYGSGAFAFDSFLLTDYTSTSKRQSFQGLTASWGGSSFNVASLGGTYKSTSAVNSVRIYCTDAFSANSTFSIYGIKG